MVFSQKEPNIELIEMQPLNVLLIRAQDMSRLLLPNRPQNAMFQAVLLNVVYTLLIHFVVLFQNQRLLKP